MKNETEQPEKVSKAEKELYEAYKKPSPIVIDNKWRIEGAEPLLKIIADMYGADKTKDHLDDIIYKYGKFIIADIAKDGEAIEKGEEAKNELDLLKEISDALKSVKCFRHDVG